MHNVPETQRNTYSPARRRKVAVGVVADGAEGIETVPARAERCARMAYRSSGLDPNEPQSPVAVLLGLVEGERIELVDIGIPTARALVEFGSNEVDRVALRARQRHADLRAACAYACARIVEWTRSEEWTDAFCAAVVGAILLPRLHLVGDGKWANVGEAELAVRFDLDVKIVEDRLRLLGEGGSR